MQVAMATTECFTVVPQYVQDVVDGAILRATGARVISEGRMVFRARLARVGRTRTKMEHGSAVSAP